MCIDFTKEAIKIFEIFFSYDKNLQLENNFKVAPRVEKTEVFGNRNFEIGLTLRVA